MAKQLTNKQALRYNRQILLPNFDLDRQEILLNARALMIGVGGLGCACAQYLVASGVGSLTLVDDDNVDLSNLQRQVLHTEDTVGMNKCLSAKASLNKINSDCNITTIDHRMSRDEFLVEANNHDIIIDCTDNLATRNLVNEVSIKSNTPLVSGAAIRMEGQVSSFIPGKENACYECLSQRFGEQTLSCVESGILSPVVGIIGSMQALEAVKILTSLGDNLSSQLLLFDALSTEWNKFTISKNLQCKACS
ncbi:molybdopterin-synthase adenylyltransferase MoeB [Alteromonadaceae bacterium M269]|nr:molybdopterin-synthase adenylyltransferase MoeB [Alteromonadaceae bacterium M269]